MQSAVVVRRELLDKVGGYDEDLRVCEDYSLWIRLAQESEIGFVDSPLVLIRRHEAHYFGETTALAELGRMFARVQLRADVADLAPLLRVAPRARGGEPRCGARRAPRAHAGPRRPAEQFPVRLAARGLVDRGRQDRRACAAAGQRDPSGAASRRHSPRQGPGAAVIAGTARGTNPARIGMRARSGRA